MSCAQGHTKLPDYVPVGQFPKTPLRDLFTAASADCLNLLNKCLIYDPRRRISAKDVSYRCTNATPSSTCHLYRVPLPCLYPCVLSIAYHRSHPSVLRE